MDVLAVTWSASTISSLATGAGTLILAVATFAAVRSSNRSARIAEMALQEQRRPLLTHSRIGDPDQKLMFADNHWVKAAGGQGTAEHIDGAVYLSISLRNVGAGIAICQGWNAMPLSDRQQQGYTPAPLDDFRLQSRDLYVPPGDIGMWQGALRDPNDPARALLAAAIDAGEPVSVELLYSDLIGRQRTVTRFGLQPRRSDSGVYWYTSMSRHWFLDWEGPRPQNSVDSQAQSTLAEIAARRAVAGELAVAEDSGDDSLEDADDRGLMLEQSFGDGGSVRRDESIPD